MTAHFTFGVALGFLVLRAYMETKDASFIILGIIVLAAHIGTDIE